MLVIFASCSEDETCRQNTTTSLQAGFFKEGTTTALSIDTLTISGLIEDPITGGLIEKDSILYNAKKKISLINLPLSKTGNQSIFLFKCNSIKDTVMILHSNQDYFVSFACGCMVTHKIDTVLSTNHFISEVKINNYDINLNNVRHLQIYH
jgi:hypothetical protein